MTPDRVIIGDCRTVLPTLDAESVQCVVTSPPYWGLRDYGHDAQLGLESTPQAYVEAMVAVFREVHRVLKPDGTLWLNIGDSYQNAKGQAGGFDPKQPARRHGLRPTDVTIPGLKPKDLVMIPARVALALQADGWWVRSEIIWHKPAPMPEPVNDRPTVAHEKVFLLTKSRAYFYNAEAIAEPATGEAAGNGFKRPERISNGGRGDETPWPGAPTRNARNVWTIASKPYDGAHFAVMPTELVQRCVLAGSRIGDTVLDPFMGSGTVGMVAESLGRRWVGIELNPAYAPLIAERTAQRGLLAEAAS
jgi:DNA modification methylase